MHCPSIVTSSQYHEARMISEAEKISVRNLSKEKTKKKKKDDDKFSSMSNVNDDLLPDMHLCGGIKLEKKAEIYNKHVFPHFL